MGDDPQYPPPGRPEPAWPSQLVVVAAIVLQVLLPDRLLVGPRWLLPALEAVLLAAFVVATPNQLRHEHARRRALALGLTALVSAVNISTLVLLTHELLRRGIDNGHALIVAGALIWLTNVLIFGLWYWETDRGGPGRRAAGQDRPPDLLYPQMAGGPAGSAGWRPGLIDYLYVSLTNATAFSPTDTMPLTPTAKAMMGLQSIVSLVTIGLVISRAVNIL